MFHGIHFNISVEGEVAEYDEAPVKVVLPTLNAVRLAFGMFSK